jgi:hypothetical protein
MRRASRAWLLAAVACGIVVGAVLLTSTHMSSPDLPAHPLVAQPTPGESSPVAGTALELLASVSVKGKAPLTGYSRVGDFGRAWLDVDHNGCDTRDDILARDLNAPVLQGRCRVVSGILNEPYTGTIIDFLRGQRTSALVQIDHMVPLANAWQTGAQQLSLEDRERLANDPLNLLAVDGRANEQKSDGDAATWLPARKTFRCVYVAHQIAVKAKYKLWVTAAEHDAMVRILSGCPAQTVPQ